MKSTLFTILFLAFAWTVGAQAPTIEGDIMLCPDTNGTASITNDTQYDSYQWYWKYWFLNDDYVAIDGANEASFTYDWYTYDQALLKVVVTKDGETFESNAIQIDSYNWAGLLIMNELQGNVHFEFNEETLEQRYVMCNGAKIVQTVLEPYVTAQWYKDGEPIEGATSLTYIITEPGAYYVVAGVEVCPDATTTSQVVNVVASEDCGPATPSPLVIQGDTMLCPDNNGLAFVTNAVGYDTYQWYAKFSEETEFEAIDDATVASFNYDQATYGDATIKVEVTKDGETYTSNELVIATYDIAISFDSVPSEGVTEEDSVYFICEDDSVTFTIPGNEEDFINIQWYKDGLPIENAYGMSYTATEPGVYHLDAAMTVCTNNILSTADNPVTLSPKEGCFLSVNDPEFAAMVKLYPNPVSNILNVTLPENTLLQDYSIIDLTGKTLMNGKVDASTAAINVESLSAGTYIIKLNSTQAQTVKMFIKK